MHNRWVITLLVLFIFGCGIFNPKNDGPPPPPPETLPPPTTPELLMENLKKAMENRVIEEYEDLLDDNFFFSEPSQIDTLNFEWGKDVERRVMKKIFEMFSTFTFEFTLVRPSIELKEEYPATFPDGSPNPYGHPNEDWVVWYGRVQMLILDETGENGYTVDQNMTFKMRRSNDVAKDPKTGEIMKDANGNPLYRWTIIRWIDDPVLR